MGGCPQSQLTAQQKLSKVLEYKMPNKNNKLLEETVSEYYKDWKKKFKIKLDITASDTYLQLQWCNLNKKI